ncbi:hypothetical protein SAMN02983003_3375 [Devosia enhydra]|uniref:Uncharacterized protein n=1 Tax=Devosia enhydra TaxID=665118 RepID=A0A1K2I1J6_9HYPH|nr:hypothetical protein [Devosia enhydra]SFZ86200.1 hypothetical protein SAMN02983003_3375 [Devosia enhydra]
MSFYAAIAFAVTGAVALASGFAMGKMSGRSTAVSGTAAGAAWLAAGLIVLPFLPWPTPLMLGIGVVAWLFGVLVDHRPVPAALRHGVALVLFGVLIVGGVPVFLLRTALGLNLPAPVLIGAILVVGLVLRLSSDRIVVPETHRLQAYGVLLVVPTLVMLAMVPNIATQPSFWWQAGIAAMPLAMLALKPLAGAGPMGEAGGLMLGFATGFVVLNTLAFSWVNPLVWIGIGVLALVVELRSRFRPARA